MNVTACSAVSAPYRIRMAGGLVRCDASSHFIFMARRRGTGRLQRRGGASLWGSKGTAGPGQPSNGCR
jgi:hypothetical protein